VSSAGSNEGPVRGVRRLQKWTVLATLFVLFHAPGKAFGDVVGTAEPEELQNTRYFTVQIDRGMTALQLGLTSPAIIDTVSLQDAPADAASCALVFGKRSHTLPVRQDTSAVSIPIDPTGFPGLIVTNGCSFALSGHYLGVKTGIQAAPRPKNEFSVKLVPNDPKINAGLNGAFLIESVSVLPQPDIRGHCVLYLSGVPFYFRKATTYKTKIYGDGAGATSPTTLYCSFQLRGHYL
jgi:hypothetical protein